MADPVRVPGETRTGCSITDPHRNPAYAGAYAYGRTTVDPSRRQSGRGHQRRDPPRARAVADLFAGYLSGLIFLGKQLTANQQRLRANQYRYRQQMPSPAGARTPVKHCCKGLPSAVAAGPGCGCAIGVRGRRTAQLCV